MSSSSSTSSSPSSSFDPIVRRLIELYKKLEDAAKEGSNMINGCWQPLRLSSRGWVVAGKNNNNSIEQGKEERKGYQTNEFAPIGEWKKAAEYLALENELRALLFSDLT